jgi:hypothetical protein
VKAGWPPAELVPCDDGNAARSTASWPGVVRAGDRDAAGDRWEIADLTEHNPNVLFELGMRMAEDKPVVLIKAEGTGPLFDVDNMLRVFEYSPNLWPTTVEKDMPNLRDFIKGAWENRASEKSYMKILRGAKTKH